MKPQGKIIQLTPVGGGYWLILFENGSVWSACLEHAAEETRDYYFKRWKIVLADNTYSPN